MTRPRRNGNSRNWAVWALLSAALLQCILGFLGWAMNSYSFGWRDWLFSLSGIFYCWLGFAARSSPLPATLLGAGVYAVFLALQALHGPATLNSGLSFKIPVASLLLGAVVAALWHPGSPRKLPTDRPTI